MTDYIRMVSYLNVYKSGDKQQNCGFSKIDSRNGVCRVYMNVQLPFIQERLECTVHMFVRSEGFEYGIRIGNMAVEHGRGSFGISMPSDKIGNTNQTIEDIAGIYITTAIPDMIFASEWDDLPIVTEQFADYEEKKDIPHVVEEEPMAKTDTNIDVEVESIEESAEEKVSDEHKEFWTKLGKRCVKMKPVGNYAECIRMKPNDIVCLPKHYWGLGSNSFLLHSYYNYRYLLMARYIENNKEKYILGIPGVYHMNEKIMAGMFGFSEFLGDENEGENGYWYMYIE